MTGSSETRHEPLVSVIVPCWNAEANVERALSSVLRERSFDLECLVVDDASTDRTAEIVDRLAAADSRIVLVRLATNGGVSNARNQALAIARGSWLTMLDADDRFVGGGVGALLRAALDRDALAVVGQQVWTDGRHRWITELYDRSDIRTGRRTSLARAPGLVYHASPHAKLVHRSLAEGLRFEGRVLGDQPWVIRTMLRAGEDLEVIDETVYEWWRPRRGEATTSITRTTRSSADRGVEAAGVAAGALRLVLEEAAVGLDPGSAQLVGAAYVERLLRSDLAAHLAGAIRRRDPRTPDLLAAIRDFVAGVPDGLLERSTALTRDVLEPPLHRWPWLRHRARSAFWRLLETAAQADPSLWQRGSSRLARLGLRLLAPPAGNRAAGVAVMLLDAGPSAARRGVRRAWRAVQRRR